MPPIEPSRARSILITGIAAGLITGVVVGLIGRWLEFSPAVTGAVIGAVTGATVTSLHIRRPPS